MHQSRRSFLRTSAGTVLTGVAAATHAQTSNGQGSGRQVPGIYRIKVGTIEVSALLDGYLDFVVAELPNADEADANRLLKDAFQRVGTYRAPVNCFVVRAGNRTVLVDSGGDRAFAPTLGWLPQNLGAAGFNPREVDAVLLTHIHPDHSNGLVTTAGEALFPRAEIHVRTSEYRFWTGETNVTTVPAGSEPFFRMARRALKPYSSRLALFEQQPALQSIVSALAAPGHTPGHSAYRISSGRDQLLIWGDAVQLGLLQFARPEWTVVFDVAPSQAASTRKRLLDMAATDRIMVAGMHLPFPGFGFVERREGRFAFVPAPWEPAI